MRLSFFNKPYQGWDMEPIGFKKKKTSLMEMVERC